MRSLLYLTGRTPSPFPTEPEHTEEQPRLLPLPLHPFNTDRMETVRSRKTIYVHFDLNDYSIPPGAVNRPLTLMASDTEVRLLDDAAEIARHHRSYDRQATCDHDPERGSCTREATPIWRRPDQKQRQGETHCVDASPLAGLGSGYLQRHVIGIVGLNPAKNRIYRPLTGRSISEPEFRSEQHHTARRRGGIRSEVHAIHRRDRRTEVAMIEEIRSIRPKFQCGRLGYPE